MRTASRTGTTKSITPSNFFLKVIFLLRLLASVFCCSREDQSAGIYSHKYKCIHSLKDHSCTNVSERRKSRNRTVP